MTTPAVMSVEAWAATSYPLLTYLRHYEYTQGYFIVRTLMWVALFVVSYYGSFVSGTFRALRVQDRVFWSLAIVRAVFGAVFAPLGIYTAFVVLRSGSIVDVTAHTSCWAISNAIGFFIFECVALVASNVAFKQFDPLLFIHHVISLSGFSVILYTGHLHYFGVLGLILECSTPFTAMSWIAWKMGYDSSSAFVRTVQMLMVHMFHGRSFVEFFVWIQTARHYQELFSSLSWLSIVAFYPALALMSFLLTPSWLLKKTRQLSNLLHSGGKSSKPGAQHAWAAISDPDVLSRISARPTPKNTSPLDKRRLKTM